MNKGELVEWLHEHELARNAALPADPGRLDRLPPAAEFQPVPEEAPLSDLLPLLTIDWF